MCREGAWTESVSYTHLIEKGQLYVIKDDTGIHGVFAFIIGKEPTYEKIEPVSYTHLQK